MAARTKPNALDSVTHQPFLMPGNVVLAVMADNFAKGVTETQPYNDLIGLRYSTASHMLELFAHESAQPVLVSANRLDPLAYDACVWVYRRELLDNLKAMKGQRVNVLLNAVDQEKITPEYRDSRQRQPKGLRVHQPVIAYKPVGQRVSHWLLRKRWQNIRQVTAAHSFTAGGKLYSYPATYRWEKPHSGRPSGRTFYAPRTAYKRIFVRDIVEPRAAVRLTVPGFRVRLSGKVAPVFPPKVAERAVVWSMTLSALDLKPAAGVTGAAARDDHRPALTYTLFRPGHNGKDDVLRMAAADGYRLYVADVPVELGTFSGKASDALVEAKGWAAFLKTLPRVTDKMRAQPHLAPRVRLEYLWDDARNDGTLVAELDGKKPVELYCGDWKFPPFENVIPKSYPTTLRVAHPADLLAALKRVEVYARDNAFTCRLSVVPNTGADNRMHPYHLRIVGKSQERGDADELHALAGFEGSVSDLLATDISLDVTYLMDAVKWAADSGLPIVLQLKGPANPMRFDIGDRVFGVLMPMSR